MTDDGGFVQCSYCRGELLGRVVGLFDQEHALNWDGDAFRTYQVAKDGDTHEYILLHEKCFDDLMREMRRLELSTLLTLVIGTMEDIRAGIDL